MRQTLEVCEKEPKEGEVRGCATNVESLADFARGILGSDSKVEILRSSLLSNPSTPLVQNYTILEFAEMSTGDIVPCHSEPYPYPVYYCHFQLGAESKVFKVHLRGENGEMIDSAFLCHMDTSTWRPGHVAFRLLGVKAGDTEVCHFMAAHDLAMFPVPK
ncbi:BURP domain-containing protein 5-like [Hibiscus syriacus]|nr:BURP domain-containing protein 5-like [Hibiscus syriacus]